MLPVLSKNLLVILCETSLECKWKYLANCLRFRVNLNESLVFSSTVISTLLINSLNIWFLFPLAVWKCVPFFPAFWGDFIMLPFNFYLQKLVCKQTGRIEIRFWKLDMEELWTVQPQEFWVMKNIVIKMWFQDAFSCLHEVRWRNSSGYTWQVLGEGQITVEEWSGLNFLYNSAYIQNIYIYYTCMYIYIYIHGCNMFLNRRLYFSSCLLSPLPNPEITSGLLHVGKYKLLCNEL